MPVHGEPFKLLKRFAAGWGLAELCESSLGRREEGVGWQLHPSMRFSTDRNPGPIQYEGPGADDVALSLAADTHDYVQRIDRLRAALEAIRDVCRPGVSDGVLDAALTGATSLAHIIAVMKERE